MSALIKWIIQTIIAPLLINWVAVIYKKIKKDKDLAKKSEEASKDAEQYEKNPTPDNFDQLP